MSDEFDVTVLDDIPDVPALVRRVQELENKYEAASEALQIALRHIDAAEARVKELEEALREIAGGKTALPHEEVARRALGDA